MVAKKKPCKHRFQLAFWTGRGRGGRKRKIRILRKTVVTVPLTFGFRCGKCDERIERPATPRERALFEKRIDWRRANGDVHKVWHEFERRFKKQSRRGGLVDAYRFIGYDLMCRVEKWAKRYPRDVRLVCIDDSYFCGSRLLLVEHCHSKMYMGTTVVVIPQCTGEKPLEFFMYPGHLGELARALASVRAAARPIEKRQRKDEAAKSTLTRKFIRHPPVI